ncbi:aminomethyl-transferring glycine dehydrogenase subunit GcvPB [candidate division KSB1 bacterium]|nr:aminomethyl-transferring glycine dehydrogenase subunit GcvPB [candidate division KSB1 bacterium]
MPESVIFELSRKGRKGYTLDELDVPETPIEEVISNAFLRDDSAQLPEVSENEVVRHFVKLSQMNYHIDQGFYPLGSCTMKYNPKINEETASLPGMANVHPYQPESTVQGCLQVLWEIEQILCDVTGLKAVTTQPAAGSHGELAGIMFMRKYHERNKSERKTILIPDSAHGTNPSSVTIGGYSTVEIKSNDRGIIDLKDFKSKLTDEVAGLMVTNPNTLGFFEKDIKKIADALHENRALLYMDGANLNALLGFVKPGDLGVDILHINLHKTFSTPHGGGGPGAGPVAVSERLVDFLPVPRVVKSGDNFSLDYDRPDSIGQLHGFYGNFGILVRALTYMTMLGKKGMRRVSENAILNANYLLSLVRDNYEHPYGSPVMHEFVLSTVRQKGKGIKTLDIAKRLLDFGFHAPTTYFPLIVKEALMIEPTETETKETLEAFADALNQIAEEVNNDPDLLRNAPVNTPVSRLDEVKASKEIDVRYSF